MSDAVEGEIVSLDTKVRLTKFDEKVVQALELAFQNGYNITEACLYVDISRDTFYRWMGEDDNFSYRMSIAQTAINRKAKTNVQKAINDGDPNISLRYLTLRDPDFKPKATLEPPDGQERTEEKLKEFLNDRRDGAYPDTNAADDGSAEPVAEIESGSRGDVASSPPDIS